MATYVRLTIQGVGTIDVLPTLDINTPDLQYLPAIDTVGHYVWFNPSNQLYQMVNGSPVFVRELQVATTVKALVTNAEEVVTNTPLTSPTYTGEFVPLVLQTKDHVDRSIGTESFSNHPVGTKYTGIEVLSTPV